MQNAMADAIAISKSLQGVESHPAVVRRAGMPNACAHQTMLRDLRRDLWTDARLTKS